MSYLDSHQGSIFKDSDLISNSKKYKPDDWDVTIMNTGPQKAKAFNRLYCTYCNDVLLPPLLNKHSEALGGNPNLVSFIANWDLLKISDTVVEYVGCFLPWNKAQIAGPSSNHFLRDPADHAKTTHPYTVTEKVSKAKRKQASVDSTSSKVVVVERPSSSSSSQSTLIG